MKDLKSHSKFLSLVLRHAPEKANLSLDASGWCNVEQLLKNCKISRETLNLVVAENNKKRFEFSPDEKKIRASQGHSIQVDLGYQEEVPPTVLYHGTSTDVLNKIFIDGIKKMSRHHVHLSDNIETAKQVGSRHGKPIVLHIWAYEMFQNGHKFYKSTNGVWLTDDIPVIFIKMA